MYKVIENQGRWYVKSATGNLLGAFSYRQAVITAEQLNKKIAQAPMTVEEIRQANPGFDPTVLEFDEETA